MSKLARLLVVLLTLYTVSSQAKQPPQVVVSIAPIQSLVAGVMAGVSSPKLLIQPNSDPHTYALKPSQMSALQNADLIVWVGETVEGYLPKALSAVGNGPSVIELTALPGIKLLPARKGGMWEAHIESHDHGHAEHRDVDGHLWLDVDNAKIVVTAVAKALADLDPQRRDQYKQNAQQLLHRLNMLDTEMQEMLAPVATQPYLVFHDAYQYLDAHFQLNAVGAISVDPERKPGARRLSEIRRKIESHKVVCIFSQPQFPDAMVRSLIEGTSVKHAQLDDLGSGLQIGEQLYFGMMRALAQNLKHCLNGDNK